MGVSYYVYLGPYIQVHNPKKERKTKMLCCPEPACGNNGTHISSKFCSLCGSKIIECQVPVNKRIDFDCYEQFNDRLAELSAEYPPDGMEDYMILTPNQGKIGRHFHAYDTKLEAFTEKTITEEIVKMITTFKSDLDKLKKTFGDKNVEYKWGVLAYAC